MRSLDGIAHCRYVNPVAGRFRDGIVPRLIQAAWMVEKNEIGVLKFVPDFCDCAVIGEAIDHDDFMGDIEPCFHRGKMRLDQAPTIKRGDDDTESHDDA